jgi:ribosome-associated protein
MTAKRRAVARAHRVEAWRDRLVEGDTKLMEEILHLSPDMDRQQLRQLVLNARREKKGGSGGGARSSRKLYRYLMALFSRSPGRAGE